MSGGGDLDNSQRIEGGTDGTMIGNEGDRLKIAATISPVLRSTYSASNVFTVAGSATDVFTISGSNTKTIFITDIVLYLTATAGSNATILGIRRSSLNTGGTSTLLTNITHDTNNAASTAVVRSYTANPTLGTSEGNIFTTGIYVSGGGTIGSNPFRWSWNGNQSQAITLRGTSQLFALNLNSVSFAGNICRAQVTWIEE